jgi:hypothetical protein
VHSAAAERQGALLFSDALLLSNPKIIEACCPATTLLAFKHIHIQTLIGDSLNYMEHAGRKTVFATDVIYAAKLRGRSIYGFGG